jgi:hypothetical protein
LFELPGRPLAHCRVPPAGVVTSRSIRRRQLELAGGCARRGPAISSVLKLSRTVSARRRRRRSSVPACLGLAYLGRRHRPGEIVDWLDSTRIVRADRRSACSTGRHDRGLGGAARRRAGSQWCACATCARRRTQGVSSARAASSVTTLRLVVVVRHRRDTSPGIGHGTPHCRSWPRSTRPTPRLRTRSPSCAASSSTSARRAGSRISPTRRRNSTYASTPTGIALPPAATE